MDPHGLDDPTTHVHAMYSPDSHAAGTDADPIGHGLGSGGDGSVDGDLGAGTPADPQGVELDVDGHVSVVSATIDTDDDGRADTAVINSDDGTHILITDSDHDGVADRALLVDDHGQVVDSATFDESSGRWHSGGAQHSGGDTPAGDGGHANSTVPTGTQAAAAATASPGPTGSATQIEFDADGRTATVQARVDTDHDGRPDTAIVDGGDSGTVAVTDTDGDGRADEAALISDGHVVDTAHVDPHTGQWVRGDDGRNPYSVGEYVPGAGGSASTDSSTSGGSATSGSTTTGGSTGDSGPHPPDTGNATSTASDGPSHGREQPLTVDAGGRTSTVEAVSRQASGTDSFF